MNWQPIETAPRDHGKQILAFDDGDIRVGYWSSNRECFRCEITGDPLYRVTHWMPLPEPPKP